MSPLPSLIGELGLSTLCTEARSAPPGAIVEVGVYKGGSAARLYEVALWQRRTLYLYDTFTGHPRTDAIDDHEVGRYGDAISPDRLREWLPGAQVIVGTFPDSIIPMEALAFVHADADLYGTTRDICISLPPLMVSGGIMLFDDYSHGDCRGARQAIDELLPWRTVLEDGRARVVIP